MFGFCFLCACILGGSLLGPVSNFISSPNFAIRNAWRNMILVLYFIIPSLVEIRYVPKGIYAEFFSLRFYLRFFLMNLFLTLFNVGLVYGATQIIQIQAYIFNTSCSQFILLFSFICGVCPIRYELIGLGFVILGQVCMILDGDSVREDGKQGNFYVYLVCILSGVGGAGVFIVGSRLLS